MIKDKIDDLVDILGEAYAEIENTFLIRNNQQLLKYLDNPKEWKNKQLENRLKYKKLLVSSAKKQIDLINGKAEKVFLLSYKQIDDESVKITESEIVAENLPSDVKEQIKAIKEFNAKEILKLANQSLSVYQKQVQIINKAINDETLYEAVKNQMPKGINNGFKVNYTNGKQFSWKAYMEMNLRTTVHQEMTNHQIKVGAKLNQVFYICNSFSDCAPDHADYQAKIYYNADSDIGEKEQEYIDQNNILSMQEVINNEPFLTSRPNCRHEFHAIPTSEVLNMSEDEILEKENLKFGDYKSANYDKLMEQRKNERQIRKWKLREENAKKIAQSSGLKDVADVKYASQKVKEWQARQRDLISKNKDVLTRQYERENAKIIVNDLGVSYKYKVQDDKLVKR